MTIKTYKIENLTQDDKIIISSKENNIDFSQQCTHVVAYFDDFSKPEYYLYAEIYIHENNQKQTTIFELPSKGKNATIVIQAITNYNIDDLIVSKK